MISNYNTYKDQKLKIYLSHIEFDCERLYSKIEPFEKSVYDRLIVNTPSTQSSRKTPFNQFGINSRNTKKFIEALINSLKVDEAIFFTTYDSKKNKDMFEDFIDLWNSEKSLLAVYCPNSIKQDIYDGIRNAIAHGNFYFNEGFYVFFAVSKKNNTRLESAPISFLFRTKKISLLKKFYQTLDGMKLRK